jgi:selenide,water dikinase
VAGGHSIDSAEPIYGLAVIGECTRETLRTNAGVQPGDALILTKPIGVGVYSAALKRRSLDKAALAEMVATTTLLNTVGMLLGGEESVHALTDVTGFGLLGHGLEMARASGLSLEIDSASVPLLTQATRLAQEGVVTGASQRNWASVADGVALPVDLPEWRRDLLTDPQTSGGLLVAVAPEAAQRILGFIKSEGFPAAAIVGLAGPGPAQVIVRS